MTMQILLSAGIAAHAAAVSAAGAASASASGAAGAARAAVSACAAGAAHAAVSGGGAVTEDTAVACAGTVVGRAAVSGSIAVIGRTVVIEIIVTDDVVCSITVTDNAILGGVGNIGTAAGAADQCKDESNCKCYAEASFHIFLQRYAGRLPEFCVSFTHILSAHNRILLIFEKII